MFPTRGLSMLGPSNRAPGLSLSLFLSNIPLSLPLSPPSPPRFYNQCKTLILQFVLVEPILAAITFILSLTGGYSEGDFSPTSGYLWIMLTQNTSISVCLYYLVLFWCALGEELEAFSPVGKFLCIKVFFYFLFFNFSFSFTFFINFFFLPQAVIFFAFW